MSFFDDASLALIPSGVKESKVYSIKPTDGSGDLTFSRSNDTATRVGSDGLIEKVRTNQVLQSETLDNAYWNKTNVSITANAIANPLNGALTADLLTVTNPIGPVEKTITNANQSYTAGTPYTISAYFKAGTISSDIRILAYDDVTLYLSGIIDLATIGNSTAAYEDIGGGWYRFRFTFTPNNSTATGLVYLVNYAYGVVANTGTNVYVFGAQLETGDIATPYIATTSAAVSVGQVANLPRLDYSGGATCPKLLLEPQRTNLALYSEQFDNAAWAKTRATITANNTTSPDGYVNADKLVEDTNTGTHQLNASAVSVSDATPNTISIFAKKGGANWLRIEEGYQGVGCYFDLENGVVGTKTVNATSATITEMSDGWYRCIVTGSSYTLARLDIYLADADSSSSYTGDGTSGVYIFGASLEKGSYATSYIPTLSAAVTRGADAASKTGISSLIGQTEGVVFLEVGDIQNNAITGSEVRYFEVRKDQNNSFGLSSAGGTPQPVRFVTKIAGSVVTESEPAPFANSKIAIKYTATQFKLFINGSLKTTVNKNIGGYVDVEFMESASEHLLMILEQFLIFPTALTDAECIALTTI
tara:strand:- start:748 stop:2517 length:1770 start_codon:yes stop_codon:yes gene_type:complete